MAAYCTVEELKAWIGRENAVADSFLEDVAETTSRWIEEYTQRRFFEPGAAEARIFAVTDRCTLDLGRFNDAATVTTVKTDEDGDGVFETTWAASDYELLPLNRASAGPEERPITEVRPVNRWWPWAWSHSGRSARIEVTGTWGWPAVPDPVKHACLLQASRLWMRRKSPQGILGGFADFGPVRVSARLDPDVEDLLEGYRHPTIAVLMA